MARLSGSATSSQLFILVGFAAHLLIGLALTILLGRHLSAQDFGFFALIASVFAFARDTMDMGTTAMASREIPRHPEHERPLLEGLIAWRRLVGIVLAVGALVLSARQQEPARQWILVATAAGLVSLAPSAFAAVFQARQILGVPTLVNLGCQVGLLAACAILVAWEFDGPIFAGLIALRESLAALLAAAYGCWLVGYRPRPGLVRPGLRHFVGGASLWALATACRHVYGQMDVFAVYLIRGEAELGALAAAYRPIAPAFLIPWVAAAPLVPVLSTFKLRGLAGQFDAVVASSSHVATAVGALGTACAFVLAPELIFVLYGGRYMETALDAVIAFRWLALAILPVCWMAVYSMALLAADREKSAFWLIAVGLACKIALNLLLVPRFGFYAAVATTAISEFALALALAWAFKGKPPQFRLTWTALAALAPAATVIVLTPVVPAEPIARLAVVSAAAAVSLLLLLRSRIGKDYFRALSAMTL